MAQPSGADELVLIEKRGRVAILRLNRPDARNAINPAMAHAIEAAIDHVETDDDVWVGVLTGAGDTFCAGADLKEVSNGKVNDLLTQRGGFGGFVNRDRSKPVIAAVNGPALAGGCELALACDLIVAARSARFGIPEVKRSLVAIAGGLARLPEVLPKNIAMEMALTGDPISAETAERFGMVNHLVDDDELLDAALQLAGRIEVNAPLAVRASRRGLLDMLKAPTEDIWKIGWRLVKPLFATHDFREGPRAFIEKRKPNWTAR